MLRVSLALADCLHLSVYFQVLPLVESSLLEASSQLHRTPLYSMVSQLLAPAHRCQTIPGAAEFWNHLSGTMLDALDIPVESSNAEPAMKKTRATISEKLLNLIRAMYYPDLEAAQKPGKVTFRTDDDIDKSINEIKLTDTVQKQKLGEPAASFVHKLVQQAFKSAYSNNSSESLQLLSVMLEIDKDSMVSDMIQCVTDDSLREVIEEGLAANDAETDNKSNNNSVHEGDHLVEIRPTVNKFVFDVCMKWLSRLQTQGSERDLKSVLDIVSLFLDSLDSDGTVELMVKLNEVCWIAHNKCR